MVTNITVTKEPNKLSYQINNYYIRKIHEKVLYIPNCYKKVYTFLATAVKTFKKLLIYVFPLHITYSSFAKCLISRKLMYDHHYNYMIIHYNYNL